MAADSGAIRTSFVIGSFPPTSVRRAMPTLVSAVRVLRYPATGISGTSCIADWRDVRATHRISARPRRRGGGATRSGKQQHESKREEAATSRQGSLGHSGQIHTAILPLCSRPPALQAQRSLLPRSARSAPPLSRSPPISCRMHFPDLQRVHYSSVTLTGIRSPCCAAALSKVASVVAVTAALAVQPRCVISVGSAGALHAGYRVGDVLIADGVLQHDFAAAEADGFRLFGYGARHPIERRSTSGCRR